MKIFLPVYSPRPCESRNTYYYRWRGINTSNFFPWESIDGTQYLHIYVPRESFTSILEITHPRNLCFDVKPSNSTDNFKAIVIKRLISKVVKSSVNGRGGIDEGEQRGGGDGRGFPARPIDVRWQAFPALCSRNWLQSNQHRRVKSRDSTH